MSKFDVKESFNWLTPEFKTVDSGKNTIKIRGIALKGNAVSRNDRHYVEEELVKAARSWIGKPVTINHNMNEVVGTVEWMEYEDGDLEYLATIKKQPYVSLLRNKSADIKGVSIEAAYLHNMCPRCGEKFYSEQDYHDHMQNVEYIKNYHASEPHGIAGQAFSLVLTPEEPGFEGSTIQLMETWQRQPQLLRLLETVIKTEQEKKSLTEKIRDKAAVQPISRITVDKAKKLSEQDEPSEAKVQQDAAATDEQSDQNPPIHPVLPLDAEEPEKDKSDTQDSTMDKPATPNPEQPETKVTEQEAEEPERDKHGCVVGKEKWDGTKCVAVASEALECPDGFHPNEDGSACVADESTEETVEENPPNQEPVPHPASHKTEPQEHEKSETLPEEHTVVLPPPPETKVVEIKLPKKLRLGEPFSGYDSHEDCVNKNRDKEDPDAYCASIKQKVEGETLRETMGYNSSYARDMRISHSLNMLNEAIAKLSVNTPKISRDVLKYMQESNSKMFEGNHKNFELLETYTRVAHEKIGVLSEAMDKAVKNLDRIQKQNKIFNDNLGSVATESAKQKRSLNTLVSKTQLTPIHNKLENVLHKEDLTYLQNEVAELKKLKETIEGLTGKTSKFEQEINEKINGLTGKLDEQKTNQVKETTAGLTKLEVRIDNLEEALPSKFKAKSQRITETSNDDKDKPFVKDPHKGGK